MLRPKYDLGGLQPSCCKVRKRGCSSSSPTSSSALQNYRLKRTVLVGRRGGTTTPFSPWRIDAGSPCSTVAVASECSHSGHYSHAGGKEKPAPVSARRLATALWALNEVPKPRRVKNWVGERRVKTDVRGRGRSAFWRSLPPHLSDPSHSPVSEATDKSGLGGHKRRAPAISHKGRLKEGYHRSLDSGYSDSVLEMEMHSRDYTSTSCAMGVGSRLKDLSKSLTAFKQLLRLLDHTWSLDEQHSYAVPLLSVLHSVQEQACIQVNQLMEEQRSACIEIDRLKRWFMEERTAWEGKVQDRIKFAVQPSVNELKLERKLRQRSERLNQKIGMELTETKAALVNVTKQLQSERRSRAIIQQIYYELVRGIGEDKAQAEEMKRKSSMAREELEKDREMLLLADSWREERVHMKLSEAKYHFEEKNAAIDQLRNQLKAFLPRKLLTDNELRFIHKTQGQLKHLGKSSVTTATSEGGLDEVGDEVDSMDSDLHSIELNMDGGNKSYSWSYAGRELAPLGEKFEGRTLADEKMSRGRFSPEKDVPEATN